MSERTKIIALNGTNFWPMKYGRLEHFFERDAGVWFPYRSIWRVRDYAAAVRMIDEYVEPFESYTLIGFSRGATLAHLIAAHDCRVNAVVSCSALVPPVEFKPRKECAALITCNVGEKESMTNAALELFVKYREVGAPASLFSIAHQQWPAHRFGPAVPIINEWYRSRFGHSLPVVMDEGMETWLWQS